MVPAAELFFASCFGFPHIICGVTPSVDFDSRKAGLILVLLKHFELFVKVTPVKLFAGTILKFPLVLLRLLVSAKKS